MHPGRSPQPFESAPSFSSPSAQSSAPPVPGLRRYSGLQAHRSSPPVAEEQSVESVPTEDRRRALVGEAVAGLQTRMMARAHEAATDDELPAGAVPDKAVPAAHEAADQTEIAADEPAAQAVPVAPESVDQEAPEPVAEGQRKWAAGEVRPAIREAAGILEERGIDPAKLVWPSLQKVLPHVLDPNVTSADIRSALGGDHRRVAVASVRILRILRAAVPPEDADRLSQPTGPIPSKNEVDPTKAGPQLREYVDAKGMTIDDFAEAIKVSPSTAQRMLAGLRHPLAATYAQGLEVAGVPLYEREKLLDLYTKERAKVYRSSGSRETVDHVLAISESEPESEAAGQPAQESEPQHPESQSTAQPQPEPESDSASRSKRWGRAAIRPALRQLVGQLEARAIDPAALLADRPTLQRYLPGLLDPDRTNKQLSEEHGVSATNVTNMAGRLVEVLGQRAQAEGIELPRPDRERKAVDPTRVGPRLRARADELGLSVRILAERLELPPNSLSNLYRFFNGHAYPPQTRLLRPLLRELGVSDEEAARLREAYVTERRKHLHLDT